MYAARQLIFANTDKKPGQHFDQYFTQQLLPDYMARYAPSWNVVFDARGHVGSHILARRSG